LIAKDIDRDINAAKNCRDEGIRILFSSGTGETAKGRNVRQRRGRKSTVLDAVAHGGNPQDRSASLVAVADEFGSQHPTR